MNNLKELTKKQHTNAETQEFVKVLFKDIDPELYATYLWNQFPQYELLEVMADRHGLFNDFPEVKRSKAIHADMLELWPHKDRQPSQCKVVKEYLDHIMSISGDPHKLMAHVYVRHMGDLSGGQMIAKRVPGEGRFYKFDGDVDTLKEKLRSKCDDSMAEEAKICFEFATKLFKEMMEHVDK